MVDSSQAHMHYVPPNHLDLPVLDDSDGTIIYVRIPIMSEDAFEFFKDQLDRLKSGIVRKDDPEQDDEGVPDASDNPEV